MSPEQDCRSGAIALRFRPADPFDRVVAHRPAVTVEDIYAVGVITRRMIGVFQQTAAHQTIAARIASGSGRSLDKLLPDVAHVDIVDDDVRGTLLASNLDAMKSNLSDSQVGDGHTGCVHRYRHHSLRHSATAQNDFRAIATPSAQDEAGNGDVELISVQAINTVFQQDGRSRLGPPDGASQFIHRAGADNRGAPWRFPPTPLARLGESRSTQTLNKPGQRQSDNRATRRCAAARPLQTRFSLRIHGVPLSTTRRWSSGRLDSRPRTCPNCGG